MNNKSVAAPKANETKPALRTKEYPFFSLQREMNRVFDNFFQGTELWPFGQNQKELLSFQPNVDVVEAENEYKVKAELPGLDEKSVHVSFAQNTLTLKGEKTEEIEDKAKDYYQLERRWGSFYRSIPLAMAVDISKSDAVFKNGVLTVTLPKSPEVKKGAKEIPVHG